MLLTYGLITIIIIGGCVFACALLVGGIGRCPVCRQRQAGRLGRRLTCWRCGAGFWIGG